MIGKLRRNFIFVAMCSTIVVLAVIIGALIGTNYSGMIKRTDGILKILEDNDGIFPEDKFQNNKPGNKPSQKPDFKDNWSMSPETPFETRYFSVKISSDGQVVSSDTGKVAAVDENEAAQYAKQAYESSKTYGFCGNYRYKKVADDDGYSIIFVDMGRDLSAFRTLLWTSIEVSAAGVLAVFILVMIFSKAVFKPVAASYIKQRQFITDASHELKTPLTIIAANVEVLEMEGGESSWTKSISHQVKRLSVLVEQLVTLSRMDEGGNNMQTDKFTLSDAVRETTDLFIPVAVNEGKQLKVTVDGEYTYTGDERMIRQMISLLMDNAMKYSDDGGNIEVNVKQKGKKYMLTFSNSVLEIQKGSLDCLFERFYRLDSSRNSKTGGSGIGLSIVKSIVELHKGRITAKSDDGKSIVFTVVF